MLFQLIAQLKLQSDLKQSFKPDEALSKQSALSLFMSKYNRIEVYFFPLVFPIFSMGFYDGLFNTFNLVDISDSNNLNDIFKSLLISMDILLGRIFENFDFWGFLESGAIQFLIAGIIFTFFWHNHNARKKVKRTYRTSRLSIKRIVQIISKSWPLSLITSVFALNVSAIAFLTFFVSTLIVLSMMFYFPYSIGNSFGHAYAKMRTEHKCDFSSPEKQPDRYCIAVKHKGWIVNVKLIAPRGDGYLVTHKNKPIFFHKSKVDFVSKPGIFTY